MTWSPLRLFFTAIGNLGGGFKRENEMDVNIFSRYDHFMNQALSDGLAFLKRELIEIGAQQLAKGLGMLNDLALQTVVGECAVFSSFPSTTELWWRTDDGPESAGRFLRPRFSLNICARNTRSIFLWVATITS
jgi:hypothetical protein